MNQPPADAWRPPGPPPQNPANPDPGAQRHPGPFTSFGPAGPQPFPGHLPPPPPQPYHQHQHQPSGSHSLSIADLTQGQGQPQHQYNTQPPPPNQGHPMATLGHPMPHHSPQYMPRERDVMREHELRERERNIDLQRQQEAIMRREQEAREKEMEQMHREQQQQQQQRPMQSHAGSMPIHQPIPSKVPNSIHGPNGLLSNGGSGPGSAQQNAPPPSSGPAGIFGLQPQPLDAPARSAFGHQLVGPPQNQPAQALFGPSPLPGQAQLPHGQQPILNDALSYLDQVKVRFSEHPDVYNRFLDIMKDFKSQAIDTPGVIERVSNLFNGHPSLIQGFNTFLPPGYRIECGTEENPDAIRVTTPSGTMTQSLQSRARPFESSNLNPIGPPTMPRQDTFESRQGWGQPHGQQVSPSGGSAINGYDGVGAPPSDRLVDQESASAMHQQEQRGVSQLQNAVSAAATGGARPAMAVSPSPVAAGLFPQQSGLFGQAGDPKRGPVEFNHAISYVNKIKNRFAQQPEIYKNFLEILQTYQRESKPIQDVYSQVTTLFGAAPDLLEDFKQFLPESAAHAKAQASARAAAADEMMPTTSNSRSEAGYGASQIAQAQTPRPAAKMPPMGQFDPPSTSKENKKRRGGPGMTATQMPQTAFEATLGSQGPRSGAVQVGNANKRQKIATQRQPQPEGPVVSPTLIPQLPEPLPPLSTLPTVQEELGFFDRAKKHIGNRASYAEFLKLINLYSQDLIDKYTLVDRIGSFIGSNSDLMSWFTNFLGIQEQEDLVDGHYRPDPGRVNLAHCRALGPSYRHLPKRDQTKTCKGRDGMCQEVLNDVWASHPTWASEDSGFIAHRKNQYEEALHRVEEERHDYDFHIESCQRTIQLMDPIVQQISAMNEADRASFVLAPGLGGASEAIPKRIIMKIYGREIGAKIMADMFTRPVAVLPIILRRLKQKLEEWKQVQREWEKLWREQINKHFWKSLDHQGINAKNTDKKNFQQKTLLSEIQAKYEEQKKSRDAGFSQPKHQLEYKFDAPEVLLDSAKLIVTGIDVDRNSYNANDQDNVKRFFLDFVPRFFGLEKEPFESIADSDQMRSDEVMDDDQSSDHRPVPRGKSKIKRGLQRMMFDRGNGRDDSVMSASRGSTPMPADISDVDITGGPVVEGTSIDAPPRRWIKHASHTSEDVKPIALDEAYAHTTFNLYANANIYLFFRLFEMLYTRLLAIKQNEGAVHEAVFRHNGEGAGPKAAVELGMIDRGPDGFFAHTGKDADFYGQILQMCEDVITGPVDMPQLEETLRRFYNQTGWQLYTVDKLIAAIIRSIAVVMSSDPKDKSLDITNLFLRDRERPDTTRAQEMQYRKQVAKLSKDGELYRISYTPADRICTIRLFPPDLSTFDSDALSDEARWQYYIDSYTMTGATEGVDRSRVHFPYLHRSISKQKQDVADAYNEIYSSLRWEDTQEITIGIDNYKMRTEGAYAFERPYSVKKVYTFGKPEENESFRVKFVRNTTWMKDRAANDVERRKAAWEIGVQEGMDGFEDRLADSSRPVIT